MAIALSPIGEMRCGGVPLNRKTLPTPASTLGIGILEHKSRGEIILDPIHRATDQVEHRSAVDN